MRKRDRYDSLFQWYAEQYHLDWRLLKAQAIAESGLDPEALSPAKALGLAQFLRSTWLEWWDGKPGVEGGPRWSRRNPEAAIRAQAAYMAWLVRACVKLLPRSGATPSALRRMALAAYNWGIGRMKQTMVQRGRRWQAHLPAETRVYIARIGRIYRDLGGAQL